jgi:hypothetical protein
MKNDDDGADVLLTVNLLLSMMTFWRFSDYFSLKIMCAKWL